MVWLPDHVWLAQKKGAKGGGGGKGWGGQATKKTATKKPAPKGNAGGQGYGNMMQMFQQMMTSSGQKGALKKFMSQASGGTAAASGSGVGQAKMFLAQWVQSKTGEQSTKDQIQYTTTQVEDAKPPEFVSEVVILPIDPSKSYKGKKAPNKKAAEAAAAEAALRQNGQAAVLKSGSSAQPKKKAAPKVSDATMKALKDIDASCKVWVGGLAEKTTKQSLSKHFADIAKPKLVEIMRKGRGVVAYDSADNATAAIAAMNGTELDGNALEVDVWTQVEKTK